MTRISSTFGSGGANVSPGGESGSPGLGDTLRDIADDLHGVRCEAIISPDASNLATAQTLANEIKAKLNRITFAKGSQRGNVAGPFALVPTKTLTYKADGGSTVTSTFNAVAAVVTSANAETFDMRGAPNLRVAINGGAPVNISFPASAFVSPAAASSVEVAAVIDAALDSALADCANSSGSPRITTRKKGTGASINILGGNARTVLGFSVGITHGTGDCADAAAVTIPEIAEKIATDSAGTVEVFDVGGRILIRTATAGASGSIQVTGGTWAATLGLASTDIYVGATSMASLTEKV